MTRNVFTKWLWDSRRGIGGWTLAIVLAGCGYAAFWPTIDDPSIQELIDNYPAALLEAINYTSISTAAGYLDATVYGLVVAVLLLVYAVAAGARIIAGDEEAGTLDLVLAHPVSRTSVALQRFASFTASVVLIVVVFWAVMMIIAGPAQFSGIPPAMLAAMHVHLAAFAVLFGAISFAVGAVTGRRGVALASGAVGGVLAYAASGIIPQVEGMAWVRDYSPFTWLNGAKPLINGVDLTDLALMVGISALLVAIGALGFGRRDLSV